MDTGFSDVIYQALENLAHQRDIATVTPLYSCLALLLTNIETNENCHKYYEVSTILQSY